MYRERNLNPRIILTSSDETYYANYVTLSDRDVCFLHAGAFGEMLMLTEPGTYHLEEIQSGVAGTINVIDERRKLS